MKNEQLSVDTLCAALSYAMGVVPPQMAADGCTNLKYYIDKAFHGRKVDRIFLYNPDAIARWIYEKYPYLMKATIQRTELAVPFYTVMPSVTPVCFGTMYSGVQPSVHGIRSYQKPVLSIETIFDAVIAAGRKPVIVAETNSSIARIFLDREMDYFSYDTIEEVNAKAVEIILQDKYDFVVVYNGNFDAVMHRYGPESIEALSELHANSEVFAMFDALIQTHWKQHDALVGFAMDHGCHEIDGNVGSHGLDMPEDLNIVHLYIAHEKTM